MVDDFKERVFSRHKSVGAHMPLQGLCRHTQNLHKITAQCKSSGHEATQNLSLLGEGKSVLFNQVTVVYEPHSRAGIPIYLSVYT